MASSVHFLGVGDATCADGAHTAILYEGSQRILVDCGPTVPQRCFRVLGDPDALDAIWITHQHADHCFGLPSLLLRMRLAGRKKPLEVLGGPGSSLWLRAGLELGYPGSFEPRKCYPITFSEVEPGLVIERPGVRLSTAQTQHRVRCHCLRIDDGPRSVCMSGDGKPTQASMRLYQGADLVVHECEWASRVTEDHSNLLELGPLFDAVSVGRVALVHCNDAERADIAERLAREASGRAWLPQPGETWI